MPSGQEAQQQAPSVFVSFVAIDHVSLYLVTATLPHYSVRNNQNEKLTSFAMHTIYHLSQALVFQNIRLTFVA